MQKIILFLETYSGSVLRLAMAAVILWFSAAQFSNASQWTAYVPDSVVSTTGLSAIALVYFNAVFELVFGLLLLFGWQTRLVAFLLTAHLFDIMYIVGYGEIGVRDFGLAFATFVVFMNGADPLCVQNKKRKQKIVETIPQQSFYQPAPQSAVRKINAI
ncbi:MAG: DoxX family membrane protein [Minisyncoccia bacterium]